ncbi:MAG: hypothetical protein ACKO2Z_14955, partial [Sphaerospermopsis kisseleviana]
LGVTLYNQGNLKAANQALKRARKEYVEQGNTEQAAKIDEMTQKLTAYLTPKKPEVNQTTTTTPTPESDNNADIILPPPEQVVPVNPTDQPNIFELQLPPPEQLPTNSQSN